MSWYEKLAKYIERKGGKRQLFREGTEVPVLYMERYYIAKCKYFEIMLHNFHIGDRPDFHDHPWFSGGWILNEGYIEHTPDGSFERRAGDFGARGAKAFHWVELSPNTGGKVWTLFFTFKRVREWGFLVNNKWVHFEDYFKANGTLSAQSKPEIYKGVFFPKRVA